MSLIFSDIATLSLISSILVLSLLSICFIFHLRFKTRTSTPLFHNFNSLWTVRFSLVFLIILWSVNELFRLPFFRSYLFTISQQSHLCKIQLLLSLGFFQPGILLILLFLVRVSIKTTPNSYGKFSFAIFFASTCFPLLILQSFAVFSPAVDKFRLPAVFRRSSVIVQDEFWNERVVCTYPLLSSVLFGVFGVVYGIVFVVSCWRVVSVVINKGLRVRIFTLAFTVLGALTLQIVFLGMSVLWGPAEKAYGGVEIVIFMTALSCAVVGEGILVISPIMDTLHAGGECCRWSPGERTPLKGGGGEKQVVVVVIGEEFG